MRRQCPSVCDFVSANKSSVEFRRNLVYDFATKFLEHVWFRGSRLNESHKYITGVNGYKPVISTALDKFWRNSTKEIFTE
jgi:hypothetical protein